MGFLATARRLGCQRPKLQARMRRYGENSRSGAEARRERQKPEMGFRMSDFLPANHENPRE